MKFIIIGILITNIYSQCDSLDELNCNHPLYGEGCEWIENIETGNCSQFNQNESACEDTVGCWGAYQYPGWYSGWYCAGDTYQIDNSYCDEIEMTECSEMNETECSSNSSCNWVEDLAIGNCLILLMDQSVIKLINALGTVLGIMGIGMIIVMVAHMKLTIATVKKLK